MDERVPARQRAVWLDVDPGHDDAMAILLAGHTRSFNLLGISTVGTEQPFARSLLTRTDSPTRATRYALRSPGPWQSVHREDD